MKKSVLALAVVFGFGLLAGQAALAAPRESVKASSSAESRDSSKAYFLSGEALENLENLCGQLYQGAANSGDKDLLTLCRVCDDKGQNCKWVACGGQ